MGAIEMNAIISTSAFSPMFMDDNRKVMRLRASLPRITINDTAGVWREGLEDRLEQLIRLQVGWDGYHARPVSLRNASFALGMIERLYLPSVSAPALVPGYNGDLQAEWHSNNHHIELHVQAPNRVEAWHSTPAIGNDGEERILTNDFTVVGVWLKELADSSHAVATAAA